jgi:uncharacterized protein YegP (UPF0339 family)
VVLFGITRSKENEMAGKFEMFTDKSGEIRWHLRASNGEIIASSQGYKSRAAAEKGIDSVKANAPGATLVDNTA